MLATPNPQDFDRNTSHDSSLLVKFFVKPRLDQQASAEAGRPIYKDVEHIDIKVPGTRSGGACRPATKADKERFSQHYQKFKQRTENDEQTEGTPLTEWAYLSRARVEELAFFNVKTVEHLAEMPDNAAAQMMGGQDLKAKAKSWLDFTKENKDLVELQTQFNEVKIKYDDQQMVNKKLAESNENLEKRLSELSAELLDMKKNSRRKKWG